MPELVDPEAALDAAAKLLKDSGATFVSIMASWPGEKEPRTKYIIPTSRPAKRGLGKGYAEIDKDSK